MDYNGDKGWRDKLTEQSLAMAGYYKFVWLPHSLVCTGCCGNGHRHLTTSSSLWSRVTRLKCSESEPVVQSQHKVWGKSSKVRTDKKILCCVFVVSVLQQHLKNGRKVAHNVLPLCRHLLIMYFYIKSRKLKF